MEILDAQVQYYPELGGSMAALHDMCHPKEPDWIDDEGKLLATDNGPALGFGEYRGRLQKDIAKLDADYLDWIVYEGDFSDQVKQVVREAVKPQRQSLKAPDEAERRKMMVTSQWMKVAPDYPASNSSHYGISPINKPFSHIAERKVFLVQCGRLDENVFPPLTGRTLQKCAFDESQEYYQGQSHSPYLARLEA